MDDTTTTSSSPVEVATPAQGGAVAVRSRWSEAHIDRLLEHLAEGLTLATYAKQHGLGRRTIYSKLEQDPSLRARVEQARRAGEDALLAEMHRVAYARDSGDPDDVQHRKLQLHYLEKRLAWSNPAVYGQKRQHEHRHAHAHRHLYQLSDTERRIRIQQLLDKARVPPAAVEVQVHGEGAGEQ